MNWWRKVVYHRLQHCIMGRSLRHGWQTTRMCVTKSLPKQWRFRVSLHQQRFITIRKRRYSHGECYSFIHWPLRTFFCCIIPFEFALWRRSCGDVDKVEWYDRSWIKELTNMLIISAAKRICWTVSETPWIQTRSLREEVSATEKERHRDRDRDREIKQLSCTEDNSD